MSAYQEEMEAGSLESARAAAARARQQKTTKPPARPKPTERSTSYRAEMEAGSLASARAAAARAASTRTTSISQAQISINKAKDTIKQAESLSKSYGAKIQWGNRTYDLGTTQGWKDYKQAIRNVKSEVNKAENQLKRYKIAKMSAAATRQAKKTIETANEIIAKVTKFVTQEKVQTTKSRYQRQVEAQTDYMAQLIAADIVDKKQAKDLIKELKPVAAGSVSTEDHAENFLKKVENKLKYYENLADYEKDIGIEELTGPNKRENINKVKARFAHMTMATAIGFTAGVPVAALGVSGGPAVGGFIAAASVATLANPANSAELNQYIEQHPEEFLGALGGALLAGATVSEVNKAFKTHTKNMNIKQRQALEKKWDKLIDDIAYAEQKKGAKFPTEFEKLPTKQQEAYLKKLETEHLISDIAFSEQQMGAEFPSRVAENLEPEGWVPYVKDSPFDEWEQYIARQMLKNSPREDIATWLMKNKKVQFMYGPSLSSLEPTILEEIIKDYPELKDPFFFSTSRDLTELMSSGDIRVPTVLDPNIFNKADLVARIPNTEVGVTPLLSTVLAEIARKGYITKADIKRIIEENNKILEKLKEQDIQIGTLKQVSIQLPKEIDITDVAEIVEEIPEEIIIPTPEPVPEPPPKTPPKPPKKTTEPPPDTPDPLPPTPPPTLSLDEKKKRHDMNLRFFMGPKAVYAVKYSYPRGKGDSVTVEARSLPDAMNRAQRVKAPTRYLPNLVDIKLVSK